MREERGSEKEREIEKGREGDYETIYTGALGVRVYKHTRTHVNGDACTHTKAYVFVCVCV